MLMFGAWMPLVWVFITLVVCGRLCYVPAGHHGPWRRAWLWLTLSACTLTPLWLRNALIISGVDPETSVVMQFLMSYPVRVTLTNLSALGFMMCAVEAYRIFRYKPSSPPVAAAQIVMDWRGVIREWSPEAATLFGWSPEETIGQELAAVLIPENLLVNGQSARELHRQGLQQFRETGESSILNKRFPTKALHKNTTLIEIEVYVTAHISSHGTRFLGSIFPRSATP